MEQGELAFGANAAGACHVNLTFANGSTYSTDVEFSGQWLPCGPNPHGCGEKITPAGPGFPVILTTGNQCEDAGVVPGDATTE
jgi:hypothetical protein